MKTHSNRWSSYKDEELKQARTDRRLSVDLRNSADKEVQRRADLARIKKPTKIGVVEKDNELAVHGYFCSEASAQKHIDEVIPVYVARSYFMDKTLTKDSFKVKVW